MSKRIFKYEVNTSGYFELELPKGAEVLSVGEQNNKAQLWVKVDESGPVEHRMFRLFGTGHLMDDYGNLEFIGTFQLNGGTFVGHLFEERR